MVVDSTLTPSLPATGGVDADLQPGQVVGEYQVEHKLGQGGFGAVFKAVHPLIGKQVAIKVLSHRFSVDPQMVSRFLAEARAVNQIRHHHIIDIFSFGTLGDGRLYYVMEYLDGEPLDKRLARRGRMPLAEAIPILRAIARALDAAHDKGIAHRDLKAENVFLATHPDGVFPKLLDFGIAKLMAPEEGLSHKTRTGAPMGTPHYMSPEQCRGRDVDHRTDMYAFGVLAYLMLTGVYPLDGDDYMTILMRQLHDEPLPPSSHQPALPAGVDAAIAWLMRKDPAARPGSLMAAVHKLEQVASGEGSAAAAKAAAGPESLASLSTLSLEAGASPGSSPAAASSGTPTPAAAPPGAPTPTLAPTPAPTESRTPAGLAATAAGGAEGAGARPRGAAESGDDDAGRARPRAVAVSEARTSGEPLDAAPPRRRTQEERRRPAPHVLLAVGALLAAAAIAAVIAVRSSGRAAAPATGQAPPDAAGASAQVDAPAGRAGGAADAAARPDAAVAAGEPAPRAPDAAAPARPAEVVVTIEGAPPNTEVRRAGVLLGTAPGRVLVPRSDTEVMLVLSADGYVPSTLAVVPSEDLARTVTLTPRASSGRPQQRGDGAGRPDKPGRTDKPGKPGKPGKSGIGIGIGAGAGSGSGEPTDDIEQFPPEEQPQPPRSP